MFAIMASDSSGRFSDYLNSDSTRVSSQVLIMCHDNTIITKCLWKHSQHQVPCFKTKLKTCTQQFKHEKYRNQANQEQPQPFFMMSPSDLLATPSSECLQERCSRYRHWETYDNINELQTTKKNTDKTVSTASVGVSCPLLNSNSMPALDHAVISWKQQVNLELTKSTILLSLDQVNSSAFGTLLRYRYQGYTLRYPRVPWICIYPRGENAAVPVRGSWRGVGETDLIRPRDLLDHLSRWWFHVFHLQSQGITHWYFTHPCRAIPCEPHRRQRRWCWNRRSWRHCRWRWETCARCSRRHRCQWWTALWHARMAHGWLRRIICWRYLWRRCPLFNPVSNQLHIFL